MSDQLLLALKAGFVVLLFLFVWRVLRIQARDLRAVPETGSSTRDPVAAGAARRGRSRSARAWSCSRARSTRPARSCAWTPTSRSAARPRTTSCSRAIRTPRASTAPSSCATASASCATWARRNGTFVGGAPLAGEHVLRIGDELRIGETELRYEE